jgi:Flp pilus assembly protein TadD
LRFGVFYTLAYFSWLPLREPFIRFLAIATLKVLAFLEHPPLITSLTPHGDDITLHSYITGLPQPLATWNGDNLHIYVTASLALVLAVPLRSWTERLRLVAVSFAVILCVTVAICTVHLKIAAETYASTYLGISLHTLREKAMLEWADRALIMVGMLGLPALLFLISYVSSWSVRMKTDDSQTPNAPKRRKQESRSVRRTVLAVAGACGMAFLAVLASPRAIQTPGTRLEGLRRILSLNPSSPYAHFGLGLHQEQDGKLQEALALYKEALRLDPTLVVAHFGKGNVLFHQGHFDQAAQCYEEVLKYNPKHASARHNLGNALHETGYYLRAAEAYEEALHLDPHYASAHKNLGVTLLRLDRPCDALPHLERAIALDRRFSNDGLLRAEISRLRTLCREK